MADSAESQIRISVQTSADTAALAAAGVKTEELAAAVKRLETTSPAASSAVETLTKATAEQAQATKGATAASQEATKGSKDLEVSAEGAAGGLADIAGSIMEGGGLAIGMNLLTAAIPIVVSLLEDTKTEAELAAPKLRQLAEDAALVAEENAAAAEVAEDSAAASRAYAQATRDLTNSFKELTAEQRERIKNDRIIRDAALAEADAQAGLDLAKLEGSGASPEEKVRGRAKIEIESAARRQTEAEKKSAETLKQAENEALTLEREAAAAEAGQKEKAGRAGGLLTKKERTGMEAAQEQSIANQRAAINERDGAVAEATQDSDSDIGSSSWKERVENRLKRRTDAERVIEEEGARQKEIADRLAADKAAVKRTGLSDRDALEAEGQGVGNKAGEARKEAEKLRENARVEAERAAIARRTYELEQQRRQQEADNKVSEMEAKEAKKAEAEAGKAAAATEKEHTHGDAAAARAAERRARSEFGDVKKAAGRAGVKGAGMDALEAAFKGMLEGDAAKGKEFSRLLALLAPKLANDRKEIDELKAAVEALRGGH